MQSPTKNNLFKYLYKLFYRIFRNQLVLAVMLLIGTLAFFYRDIVFNGHTFLAEGIARGTMPRPEQGPYGYEGPRGDYLWDRGAIAFIVEPVDNYISQSLKQGQLPLWNPYEGLGTPFSANGLAGVFDPIKLVTISLVSLKWWPVAVDFHLLFRYFLAGLFTYLFMREIGVGFIAGLTAAISFMLCTYFIKFGNISFIRSDALIPLTVYAYHKFATKGSYKTFFLTTFTIFLLITSDFPETLILHIGLGALWFLFQKFLVIETSSKKLQLGLRSGFQVMLVTVTGVLLGAFVLIPFAQFLSKAFHVHTAEQLPNYLMATWPIQSIGGYLVPSLRSLSRVSIFNVALVIYGITISIYWRSANTYFRSFFKYVLFFGGLALFIILVTYRVLFFSWLADLPIINMIFLNRCTQPHILFCLACASGISLELLFSKEFKQKLKIGFVVSLVVIGLYVLATLGVRNDSELLFGGNVATNLWVVLPIFAMFLGLFNMFIWIASWRYSYQLLVGILIVLMIMFEQAMFTNVTYPLRYYPYTAPPFITYLQNVVKPFRIVGTDAIVSPNISSIYKLDDIRFIDAVMPDHLFKFVQRFLARKETATYSNEFEAGTRFDGDSAAPVFGKAMDMLNVEYVLTLAGKQLHSEYAGASPFELVHSSVGVDVYHNKNAYPRAFVVHSVEFIPNFEQIMNRFAQDSYDPRQTVILDQALPTSFMESLPSQSTPYTAAEVTSRNINDMAVRATLDTPGVLVLSELSYPGWQAFVDGKSTPIYNAYGFMRAVALDAGTHTIEFYYRPPLFFIGLVISGGTLLVLVVVGVVIKRRRVSNVQATAQQN